MPSVEKIWTPHYSLGGAKTRWAAKNFSSINFWNFGLPDQYKKPSCPRGTTCSWLDPNSPCARSAIKLVADPASKSYASRIIFFGGSKFPSHVLPDTVDHCKTPRWFFVHADLFIGRLTKSITLNSEVSHKPTATATSSTGNAVRNLDNSLVIFSFLVRKSDTPVYSVCWPFWSAKLLSLLV